jgi:FKBP-type peptidyl-prolyl cis-trans isomerase
MRYVVVVLVLAVVALVAALILTDEPAKKDKDEPVADLKTIDIQVGDGPEAKTGDRVKVHYTGVLTKDGTKFDSSLDRGEPFVFTLGTGQVIQGWDQGVAGMKVGGKRKLIIPYRLAYGDRGQGKIPPRSDLTFLVELLAVN